MTIPVGPLDASVPPPSDWSEGLSVLLAEDNETTRLLIRAFLAPLPLRLTFAHDGREAVSKTAEYRPDIVLMDLSMPGMDGLEATRAIRRLDMPQPRIIALTAHSDTQHEQACRDAGMDAFLTKPVHRARLLHLLAAHPAKAESPDHPR